jgi:myo-inositol 2-dehydrogenase/D-chiro-inositol 1-dehydrogenase
MHFPTAVRPRSGERFEGGGLNMSLRVGVIGAGLMGTTHVRVLSTSVAAAQLVAVSDAIAENAERIAGEVGVEAVYTDALELIRDPGVDAVVIASPGDTHEEFVLACFEAGKPVLCEKPLATTEEASRRVLEAEAALARRLVQVGFMRRFDPGYADMKSRVDGGEIGAPVLVHCAHRNATVPPSFGSEMILRDSVVHDVDTVRWLLGQEIAKVTVLTPRPTSKAPEGVRDPQFIVFETEEGALVDVEAFVNAQYGYDIRCEVVGESGTVALASPATVRLRREGRIGTDIPMRFQERFASAYVHQLQSWVASIADGAASGASAWDGYAASAVCEAAVGSLTTGQPTEVRLEARPALYARTEDLVGRG